MEKKSCMFSQANSPIPELEFHLPKWPANHDATSSRRSARRVSRLRSAPLSEKLAIAEQITTPQKVAADYDWSKHKWGMAIDVEKCIGCGNCVVACKEENGVPKEPFYFRTWIERYQEYGDETVVDSPNGGYDGFPLEESAPRNPISRSFPNSATPVITHRCCASCPVGATFETPDGAVLVDPEYCIGCRYCIQACPYGTRFLNPITGVADKCTLCYHRIHNGQQPACVENCPTQARLFGDLRIMTGR